MTKCPSKPCLGRGPRRGVCSNLIRGSAKCCPECEPWKKRTTRVYDQARGNSGERGYGGNWRKVRERKLSHDPLCQMCEDEGLTVSAVLVHHIDENPSNNKDDNLKSLCTKHHEYIHGPNRFKKKG